MDEFSTKVLTFNRNNQEINKESKDEYEESKTSTIKSILYNSNETILHPEEAYPVTQVLEVNPTKKLDIRSVEQINPKAKFIPSFYRKELSWQKFIAWIWIVITALCVGLETWAAISIIENPTVNNWVLVTLLPGLGFCIAFLVIYANKYINLRNEARNIDFSAGKPQSVNIEKLYKRLKVGHININWFCGLTYIVSLYGILLCYILGWFFTRAWGDLSAQTLANHGGPALFITVIVCLCAFGISLFLHVFLLISNYTRTNRIENFYNQQLVPDIELEAIKKHNFKRDFIIFFVVVLVLVLVVIVIYRFVKSKKNVNTVTINNV